MCPTPPEPTETAEHPGARCPLCRDPQRCTHPGPCLLGLGCALDHDSGPTHRERLRRALADAHHTPTTKTEDIALARVLLDRPVTTLGHWAPFHADERAVLDRVLCPVQDLYTAHPELLTDPDAQLAAALLTDGSWQDCWVVALAGLDLDPVPPGSWDELLSPNPGPST
jgi:hypothetical protein